MVSIRVVKTLYKSILKLSKKFDNNPTAKSFIFRKYISTHQESGAEVFYNRVIDSIVGQDKHIYQFHNDVDNKGIGGDSLANLTRLLFRTKNIGNLSNFEHAEIGDRIEVSYAVIRKFSTLWNYYLTMAKNTVPTTTSSSASSHDESFLMNLPRVQSVKEITPGTLLLAHPMTESSLRRSVVLVLRHGTTGSYGLILNRQSMSRLRQVVIGFHASMKRAFGKHIVSYGGKLRRINIIHEIDGCSGPIVPLCDEKEQFFFDTNIETLIQKVDADPAKLLATKDDALVFVGCCAWDPDQLENEFHAGYWLPVVASDAGNGKLLQLVRQHVRELRSEVDAVAAEARRELQQLDTTTSSGSTIELELQPTQLVSSEGVEDKGRPDDSSTEVYNDDMASITADLGDSDEDIDDDDDGDDEVDGYDKDYANDMWRGLLLATDEPKLAGLATLPAWIDASKIASIDWK